MLAFTHLLINPQGSPEFKQGDLLSLPPELADNYRIKKYCDIKKLGWSQTEHGYLAFVQDDNIGNRYILPGLYLLDGPKPTKTFYGYKAVFSKSQIEQHLSNHLSWEAKIRQKSEDELTALVHDLRHLSSSIYHSALEAEEHSKANEKTKTIEAIKTIVASQTMLKVRIDYLDFSNSVDRGFEIEKIPVYSRVDKVIRCFKASANHKNIGIQLGGTSYRLAEGPNILDIVPYTLIENAIKYAPRNTQISVRVTDTTNATLVTIHSMGPKLDAGESDKIFSRGYRGRTAMSVDKAGTGLGLFVASQVIKIFNGSIEIHQEDKVENRDGFEFAPTTFTFRLSTSGEDSFRKSKFESGKTFRNFVRGNTGYGRIPT